MQAQIGKVLCHKEVCECLGIPKGLNFTDEHACGKSDSTKEKNYGKEELSINVSTTKPDETKINASASENNSHASSIVSALTSSLSRACCKRKYENRHGNNCTRIPEEEHARP